MKAKPFKRCKCRDGNGGELGANCPKLRRKDGSWNPNHGSYYGKKEYTPGPGGARVRLAAGGFRTEADLGDFFDAADRLMGIPDGGPDGHEARLEILGLIREARKTGADLPDYDELRRKYKAGQAFHSETFGEFWARWIARRRRTGDIRKTTLLSYESHHRVHLHVLDGTRMDRLRVANIEEMFAGIDAKNEAILKARASEDPAIRASVVRARITGPATKQRIRATLRSALGDAEREGLVTGNVAKLVKLESGKRPKALAWTKARVDAWSAEYERSLKAARIVAGGKAVNTFGAWEATQRPSPVMVWTPAQLGVFLDVAAQHRLYAMLHLIAFRGLRRGEACGVRWVDLDLDAGLYTVAKQIVQLGWKFEEGDPKTESSDATIVLDKGTVKVLRAHRAKQKEERLAWGQAWQDTGRVFTREDGSELHPASVSELFARLSFQAELPPIRLHDLRHGAATLALTAGVEMKIVSAMLRHSSLSITADTYTTVMPEVAHEAAEAIAALVPRKVAVGESSETVGPPSVSPVRSPVPTDSEAKKNPQVTGDVDGGPPGTRTLNLRIKRAFGNVSDGDE